MCLSSSSVFFCYREAAASRCLVELSGTWMSPGLKPANRPCAFFAAILVVSAGYYVLNVAYESVRAHLIDRPETYVTLK